MAFSSQDNEIGDIQRLKDRIAQLEYTIDTNELKLSKLDDFSQQNGLAILFFAIFCAWWAKSTGRNLWLWFFMGLIFNFFTGIAIIVKTKIETNNG